MRCTNEIIADLKDGKEVDYKELKMACLVLNSICFFNHNKFKRIFKNETGWKITKQMDFPDAHADLGISKDEWDALRMDPIEYLGVANIPGTEEWKEQHAYSKKIFENITKKVEESHD